MDIVNKLLGLFITFMIMAVGPLVLTARSLDLSMKRATYNEVSNFMDKVADSGQLSDKQLEDFYLAMSSHGATMDVDILRRTKVINPDGKGGTVTSYIPNDVILTETETDDPTIKRWTKGDIIEVRFKAVSYTGSQRAVSSLTGISEPKFEDRLSKMIRK